MKIKITPAIAVCVLFLALSVPGNGLGQGTAFTYQGQLQDNGSPGNGTYNLTFSVFNTSSSGVLIAGPLTNNAVSVTNGLFTVLVDFGSGLLPGRANWLQVAVETNGGSIFTPLAPRQQLTPVPYAIYAESAAAMDGTLSASQLTSIGNTNGGTGNFFVGLSGNATMSGSGNTAVGGGSLYANTSGSDNTAGGASALQDNTTGSANTANGALALQDNTTGSDNTANGALALQDNTTGLYNTAGGASALQDNTTGSDNTASGAFALGANTSGYNNTADGAFALVDNTTGYFNTAVGVSALQFNSSGGNNTGVGCGALYSNTNGAANTAQGSAALSANTSGYGNTADGMSALSANTSGSDNTANGAWALLNNTNGSDNIALGFYAGYNFNGSESSNIDIGSPGVAGENNIIRIGSGQSQTFIAGVINGDGGGLTNLNVSAAQLTSIGNTNGNYGNFFVGPSGNATMSGSFNTAYGVNALSSVLTGNANTANGFEALVSDTNGSANVANGLYALRGNTSGSYNTADGTEALAMNLAGCDNTANGYHALLNAQGTNNIALGYLAGINFTGTESSNIDLGNPGAAGDNNIIRIGTSQTACYLAGNVYASGAVFSNGVDLVSDQNAKEDFIPLNPQTVLAKVARLPITEWNYKTAKNREHLGPMAQDFHAAFGLNGADDKHISIVDEEGVALAAIQGLNQKVEERDQSLQQKLDAKDAEIRDLKRQNDLLADRLNELEAAVKQLAANNN